MSLNVKGELFDEPLGTKKKTTGKVQLRVVARIMYHERLLSPKLDKPTDSSASRRAVRHYHSAQADIGIGRSQHRSQLRPERRLIVTKSDTDSIVLFSPHGPLTRGELDLLEVPTSSDLVYALLPSNRVSVGDSWRHSEDILALLLRVESITKSSMKSTLEAVKRDVARIAWEGELTGKVQGAQTEMEISGEYRFDFRRQRITWFQMTMRERRAVGQAVPGFLVDADLRMLISPVKKSAELADAKLSAAALRTSDPHQQLLHFISQEGGIELLHDRHWYVIVDQRERAILRMVDHGDVLAQCNLSRLPDLPAGKQIALEEFQQDVQRTLGERFGQFEYASQETDDKGQRILRLVALGAVDEVPIRWMYYHVSNDQGQRAGYLFTLEDELAERFNQSDRILVDSVQFVERASTPTAKSTVAAQQAVSRTRTASSARKRTGRRASPQNVRR